MPKDDADKVYKPEHLSFATKDDGREPTLYFTAPSGSGRLRQQHPSGLKIQEVREKMSHAFFETKSGQKKFSHAFSKGMSHQQFDELTKKHGGRTTPAEGLHHFEATFDAKTGLATSTHRSGGRVVGPDAFKSLKDNTPTIYSRLKTVAAIKDPATHKAFREKNTDKRIAKAQGTSVSGASSFRQKLLKAFGV